MKLHQSGVTLSLHSVTWHNMVIWPLIIFFSFPKYIIFQLQATEGINIAEVNAEDMISGGALWELVRISRDCSREDIRSLARRTLSSISTFKSELRRLHIEYWLQFYLVINIIVPQLETDLPALQILLSAIRGAVIAYLAILSQEKQGFSFYFFYYLAITDLECMYVCWYRGK